jgi:predicted transcriptional regulator
MINTNKYKQKKLTLSIAEDGTKDTMSYYEMARWMSLIEGIDVVSKKADQLKIPKSDTKWIKPIAFNKYITERTDSMLFEITNEGTI